MTRQEAIRRLCCLQSDVQSRLGWDRAADCFCGESGFHGTDGYTGNHYRNDGQAVEFIERVVRDALTHEHFQVEVTP